MPTKTKGFDVSKKLKKIGNHSSDTAELHFEDMRVPKRYLLGEENMGFMYLMQNFQSERIIACTSATAGGRSHDRRGHRLRARPQGLRQADHQARVLAAQVRRPDAKLEAARALTYRGAEAYNEDKYVKRGDVALETVKLISLAKIFVGDVMSEIADQCLQFHGGWGYIEEFHIARAWRDQRLFRIGGGTTETMRYYVAKLLDL